MSLAAVEQEFTSWEELMSFVCFISAPSSTSLAAVEQGITILERVDVLWARQLYTCKLNATMVIDLILNFGVEHS